MKNYESRLTYTPEIDALTPAAAWAAWEAGELTVYQVYEYQVRHNILFTPNGGIIQ